MTAESHRDTHTGIDGKGTCFTIMPFGGLFDTYYQEIYCPAIVDAGLKPVRADDLCRVGTIVKDIWFMAKEATIVLADLTGNNPNVFYELGWSHAIAKPVILLTDSIENLPFDLRALRVIKYDKNIPNWSDTLRAMITRAINETLVAPPEFVLPSFNALSGLKPPSENCPLRDRSELVRIEELARDATEIAAAGVTLISLTSDYYDFFEQKLTEGCTLRFLLLDPNSLAWKVWHQKQQQRITTPADSENSLKKLDGLMRAGLGDCQVRLSEAYLHFSLVMSDYTKDSGQMNVELLPFNVSLHYRPHFYLTKRENKKWFDFFRNQFESLWSKSSDRMLRDF